MDDPSQAGPSIATSPSDASIDHTPDSGIKRQETAATLAKISLVIFSTCFLAGYLWGRACSPEYAFGYAASGETLSAVLRASGVRYSKWNLRGVRDQTLDLSGGVIEYKCGSMTQYHDLINARAVKEDDFEQYSLIRSAPRSEADPSFAPKQSKLRGVNSSEHQLGTSPSSDATAANPLRYSGEVDHSNRNAYSDVVPPVSTPDPLATLDPNSAHSDVTAPSFDVLAFTRLLDRENGYLPPLRPPDPFGNPVRGVTVPEAIGVLVGEGQGYSMHQAGKLLNLHLQRVEGHPPMQQALHIVTLVTSGISGFALGFVFGYHDDPPCDAKGFAAHLTEKSLWSEVGQRLRYLYSFKLKRNSVSGVVTDVSSRAPSMLTLARLYHVVDAAALGETFMISEDLRDRCYKTSRKTDPLSYLHWGLRIANDVLELTSDEYQASEFARSLNRSADEHRYWKKATRGVWRPYYLGAFTVEHPVRIRQPEKWLRSLPPPRGGESGH